MRTGLVKALEVGSSGTGHRQPDSAIRPEVPKPTLGPTVATSHPNRFVW